MKNWLDHIRRVSDPATEWIETDLTPYRTIVGAIRRQQRELAGYGETELRELAGIMKKEVQNEGLSDPLLPRAYALIAEACFRRLGLQPFDEQLIAAIALHRGRMVELPTGEGKTLAAVFPAAFHALTGQGVHILTFNDYLARRDADWMRPVYSLLDLRVDYVDGGMEAGRKKVAYAADITYATARQAGFDYLRSFIAYEPEDIVIRPFHYAIVDEADALLIDEARHPLVLAGDLLASDLDLFRVARFVGSLVETRDFERDDDSRSAYLTEAGVARAEQEWRVSDLQTARNGELHAALNLALHARLFLTRDVDYLVKDGSIKLVDTFTGRVVEGRRWRHGLQSAVEAREGLPVRAEGAMLNSITLQHLLRKYPKLAGMTATARPAAEEFGTFYGLTTVVVPPHQPCRRIDHTDRIFATRELKLRALVEAVLDEHRRARPLLIGTLTVKESEVLAGRLQAAGIDCQVLNARNDEREAAIIAGAGSLGAVTISTNMAGRGTDIRPGGADERDRNAVVKLGGLSVIGANRHESVRIDRQLRGRAGRQGDPGSSRFFLSLDDELMVKYNLREILPRRYRQANLEPELNGPALSTFFDRIQRIIEGQLLEARRTLFEYSSLSDMQRDLFQGERQQWLLHPAAAAAYYPETGDMSPAVRQKLTQYVLYQYDIRWAGHLDLLGQIRDGIHLVRLGGQNPLRVFRERADAAFRDLQAGMHREIRDAVRRLREHPDGDLAPADRKRPAATWTYIVQETPFDDQLALMLLDNSNIGFQVDFLSVILLAVSSLFKKKRRR